MSGFFLTTLITAISLLVVNWLIPGVGITSFLTALFAGVSIGMVNGFVKPILAILSLPATILTLGLFSLVVNGFCFWLASVFVPGFTIHGVFAFLVGPIVLSIVSTLLTNLAIKEGIGTSSVNEIHQDSINQGIGTNRVETVRTVETDVIIDVVPNTD